MRRFANTLQPVAGWLQCALHASCAHSGLSGPLRSALQESVHAVSSPSFLPSSPLQIYINFLAVSVARADLSESAYKCRIIGAIDTHTYPRMEHT